MLESGLPSQVSVSSSPLSPGDAYKECESMVAKLEEEIQTDEDQIQVISTYISRLSSSSNADEEYRVSSRLLDDLRSRIREKEERKRELQDRLSELFILREISEPPLSVVVHPYLLPRVERTAPVRRKKGDLKTIERYSSFRRFEEKPGPEIPGLRMECLNVRLLEGVGTPTVLLTYQLGEIGEDYGLEKEVLLRWVTLMIKGNKGPLDKSNSRVPQYRKLTRCIRDLRDVLLPKYQTWVTVVSLIQAHHLGSLEFNKHGNFAFQVVERRKLPSEIWCHILSFLDFRSLLSCGRVSREFRRWMVEETRILKTFPSTLGWPRILKHLPWVEEVRGQLRAESIAEAAYLSNRLRGDFTIEFIPEHPYDFDSFLRFLKIISDRKTRLPSSRIQMRMHHRISVEVDLTSLTRESVYTWDPQGRSVTFIVRGPFRATEDDMEVPGYPRVYEELDLLLANLLGTSTEILTLILGFTISCDRTICRYDRIGEASSLVLGQLPLREVTVSYFSDDPFIRYLSFHRDVVSRIQTLTLNYESWNAGSNWMAFKTIYPKWKDTQNLQNVRGLRIFPWVGTDVLPERLLSQATRIEG